jgi:hypothetical protein
MARLAGRVLLFATLALIMMLLVGEMKALASATPADPAPILQRDQVAAVERAVETPAEGQGGTSPTPTVVLVFAGIVLMAALPPVNRVYVYHRPYHRSDWP